MQWLDKCNESNIFKRSYFDYLHVKSVLYAGVQLKKIDNNKFELSEVLVWFMSGMANWQSTADLIDRVIFSAATFTFNFYISLKNAGAEFYLANLLNIYGELFFHRKIRDFCAIFMLQR